MIVHTRDCTATPISSISLGNIVLDANIEDTNNEDANDDDDDDDDNSNNDLGICSYCLFCFFSSPPFRELR